MFNIDYKSRVPIHKQLYNEIRWLILNSSLKEGEELPSVRELASSLTINPNTIQKAYMQLRREGYIFSVPGKGNYVEKISKNNMQKEREIIFVDLQKNLIKAKMLGIDVNEVKDFVENEYKEK